MVKLFPLHIWPRGGVVATPVHVPNFGGCQGRRTGVAVTTVSNSLILGGWVTKILENSDKYRGVEGWLTTIFGLFLLLLYSIKKCHFPVYF